jgi:hypothetical protein
MIKRSQLSKKGQSRLASSLTSCLLLNGCDGGDHSDCRRRCWRYPASRDSSSTCICACMGTDCSPNTSPSSQWDPQAPLPVVPAAPAPTRPSQWNLQTGLSIPLPAASPAPATSAQQWDPTIGLPISPERRSSSLEVGSDDGPPAFPSRLLT